MKPLRIALLAALLALPLIAVSAGPSQAVPGGCEVTDVGYRCVYGPIKVDPGENQIFDYVPAIPEAGYITSARATLVDSNGIALPHHVVHLHHVVLLDTSREDLTCPQYPADRFFASGKERTKLSLPQGYGYYWSNQLTPGYESLGPIWAFVAHLDGMNSDSTESVWVRVNFGFTPASEATLISVEPVWLDVRNCEGTEPVFTVRKGSGRHGIYKERWEYTMPTGGHFVTIGGHLHDGGKRLVLSDVTTGEQLFTSVASYDKAEEPWYLTAMSGYASDPGIAVTSGDTLKLTAVYDSTHTWRDVMGIMLGFLAP